MSTIFGGIALFFGCLSILGGLFAYLSILWDDTLGKVWKLSNDTLEKMEAVAASTLLVSAIVAFIFFALFLMSLLG